jgi:uncharacterized membrane protein YdbT with pleckstrin-like domain
VGPAIPITSGFVVIFFFFFCRPGDHGSESGKRRKCSLGVRQHKPARGKTKTAQSNEKVASKVSSSRAEKREKRYAERAYQEKLQTTQRWEKDDGGDALLIRLLTTAVHYSGCLRATLARSASVAARVIVVVAGVVAVLPARRKLGAAVNDEVGWCRISRGV